MSIKSPQMSSWLRPWSRSQTILQCLLGSVGQRFLTEPDKAHPSRTLFQCARRISASDSYILCGFVISAWILGAAVLTSACLLLLRDPNPWNCCFLKDCCVGSHQKQMQDIHKYQEMVFHEWCGNPNLLPSYLVVYFLPNTCSCAIPVNYRDCLL